MPRSPPSACWRRSRSADPRSQRCRCRLPSWSGSPLRRHPARSCDIGFSLDTARMLEGGTIGGQLDVRADGPAEWIELELVLPEGVTSVGDAGRTAFRLGAGESRRFDYELACERWGAYRIGLVDVRIRSAFGLLSTTGQVDAELPLRAYPRRERLLRVVQAYDTTPFSGSQVSRAKGEGIEFADIRPFAAGDRVRRVNWRASARRERMYVNESHPERASDVILFLDSFAEARGSGEGTIDQAVRAASSLADAYLERRNRVGLVSFGGILRWLPPAMGMRQQYRIVDALIETELARSYFSTTVEVIPRRVLPPQALVIALTPLLDQRTINALLDLRARGFDLAVVDVSPIPYVADEHDTGDDLAWRLWTMWRQALHHRYERVGVPVVEWSPDRSLLGGHRGGDGIQTTHALRLRLALIAISVVAAVAVVLAPLLATGSLREDEQFLAVVALAALVFPLLGVARLLPWAVAVLAGSVLVASEHGDIGSVGIVLCAGDGAARRRVCVRGAETSRRSRASSAGWPAGSSSGSRPRPSQPVLSPQPSSPRRHSAFPPASPRSRSGSSRRCRCSRSWPGSWPDDERASRSPTMV